MKIHFALLIILAGISLVISGKTAEDYFQEAKQLLNLNKHNEALQALENAVNVDPSNYLSRFKRAITLLSIGRNKNALDDFNVILDIQPDFEQVLFVYYRDFPTGSL